MSPRRVSLASLRRRIDRIDTAIHALLVRRTAVVERVKTLKKNERVKIRPGREAEILYRLVRRHKGHFPIGELIRIWREIIVATLRFEGPFSVAVFAPHGQGGIWDLARDQYGSFTPMTRHPDARAVIRAVAAHRAAVGVLPLPVAGEKQPWWPDLVTGQERVWVIARLPFAGPGNARGSGLGALAIAPILPEPTGRDRLCIGLETDRRAGRAAILRAFAQARLGRPELIGFGDRAASGNMFWFADLPGPIRAGVKKLAGLVRALDGSCINAAVLGAYAEPLGPAELAPKKKGKRKVRRP